MLLKEYRICMPISVEEYRVGQLFMIAKHSDEQSDHGEGVEVVENRPHEDPEHGLGQYTEKRIHLSSRLPSWVASFIPRIFYVTEKAWNYYPYTITEYTCSFVPKFRVTIRSKYENNKGTTENVLSLSEEELEARFIDYIDILKDEIAPKHYKVEEDLTAFKSKKTDRGPLQEGWQDTQDPIMCSYKVVLVEFDIWGLQTKVEEFVQKAIRDILVLGHRQAFAWIDEWYGLTVNDVRNYEKEMQDRTNQRVLQRSGQSQVPEDQEADVEDTAD